MKALGMLAFLMLASASAQAATFFQYVSQHGDYVGGGAQGIVTSSDVPFHTLAFPGPTAHFEIYSGAPAYWAVDVSAAAGQQLAVGRKYATLNFPGAVGADSGAFEVTGNSRGCNKITGTFTVVDLSQDSAGNILSAGVDFEQHCETVEPALYGCVRFNSAVPCNPHPPIWPGQSFIQWVSQPGDPVGGGTTGKVTRANGYFGNYPSLGTADVRLLSPDGGFQWTGYFAGPADAPISPGDYFNALSVIDTSTSGPKVSVANPGGLICRSSTGNFTVYEIAYGPYFEVEKFAADVEQHCDGKEAGLFAGIRYNSTIPYTPPAVVYEMDAVGPHVGLPVLARVTIPGPKVVVLNEFNQPFPGAEVMFSATSCGRFSGPSSVVVTSADANGIATALDFTPTQAGPGCPVDVSALAGFLSLQFTYDVYEASSLTLRPLPAATLTTTSGQAFRVGLNVSAAAPIHGLPVSFTIAGGSPSSVASITPAATTDAQGNAFSDVVAGNAGGNYAIVMTVGDATQSIKITQVSTAHRVTGPAPDGIGTITASVLTSQQDCVLARSQFNALSTVPATSIPPHYVFPFDLVALRVDGCASGQGLDFTISYPKSLPPTAVFWRFGPTPDGPSPHWYPMPNATIKGSVVSFHLVDGALGDDDMIANGSVSVVGGVMTAGGIYQDMWWGGPQENGWGMSITQHADTLFALIYAYDSTGNPTWYSLPGGTWNADQSAYTGSIYHTTGSPFFAYDASKFVPGVPHGTFTIKFIDSNSGTLDFAIDGVSGHKDIQRLEFGPSNGVNDGVIGDMWWGGPGLNGEGIAILHQYQTLFPLCFTYDASGNPMWYSMPGGTWTAPDTYEGTIYRTSGSPWLGQTYDASKLMVFDVGTYSIRFNADGTATFTYTADGDAGTLQLVRESF